MSKRIGQKRDHTKQEHFVIQSENIDPDTKEAELLMLWRSA